jgi:2-hydroxymuconate-semialdehyde hydrolase
MSAGQQAVEAEGRLVDVDGVPTSYVEAGSGFPVLLLHGAGPGVSGASAWRTVLPALAEEFRVIAPDLLGFGGTGAAPDDGYGRRVWTRHVLALVERLGLERLSIVGTSMGGALALGAARERPAAVAGVVLSGTMGLDMRLTPALDDLWGYRPSQDAARQLLTTLAYDGALVTDEAVDARYRASMRLDTRQRYERMFPAPRQRWVSDLSLSPQELREVRQPVLLIHGLEDEIIPLRETSLRLLELLPRAELHVFGRCRHWPMVEHRDAFLELSVSAIRRHLREG